MLLLRGILESDFRYSFTITRMMTTISMIGCTPSTAAVARRRSSIRTCTRQRSFPDDDITLSVVDTNTTATEEEEEDKEYSLNKTSRRAFFEASVSSSGAFALAFVAGASLVSFPPSAFAIGFQKELKPKRVKSALFLQLESCIASSYLLPA